MSQAIDAPRGAGEAPASDRFAALARLVRHALVYGAGQAATRLVALVMLPIATAYLDRAEYGLLAVLTLAGMIAGAVLGLGVAPALGVVYFDQADAEHKARTTRTAEVVTAALAGLTLTVGVLLAFVVPGLGIVPAAAAPSLIVLQFAITAVQLATGPLLLRLQFDGRPQAFAVLGLVNAVLSAGLGVAALHAGLGVGGLLLASLIGNAAAYVAARGLATGRAARLEAPAARRLLSLGLPMVPSALLVMLIFNAAPAVLARFAALEEAGLFAVGAQLGGALLFAVAACTAAWHPFFLGYKTRQAEASAIFPLVTTAYVAAFGLAVLMFFVCAKPVVRLLAAETFWPAYRIVGIMAAVQAILGFWSFLLPGLYYAEATRLLLLPQAAAAAAALILQLLLAPRLGAEGAALGILGGTLALVAAQIAVNSWRRFAIELAVGRCLAMGAVAALAAAAQRLFVDEVFSGRTAALASIILLALAAGILLALVPARLAPPPRGIAPTPRARPSA